MERKHRDEIEGMRAVAVVAVVAFHAGLERAFLRFGQRLGEGGYVGVDVFYVLSGFLITGLLLEDVRTTGRVRLARFYARRIRRLLPLAALVLLTTLAACAWLLPTIDWRGTSFDAFASASYWANFRFAAASTQYLAENPNHSPFLHYWSLSVEEQFYLLWPGLLAAIAWWSRRNAADAGAAAFVRRLTVVSLLVVLGSGVLSAVLSGPWAYLGLHTRAWELGVGALTLIFQPQTRKLAPALRNALGWCGLVVVLLSALLFTRDLAFPGYAAWAPVLGSAFMLLGSDLPENVGIRRALSVAPLRYLGQISYAWYLWHWPLVVLAGPAVGATDRPTQSVVLAAVALSLLAAVLTHHFVENPTRQSAILATGYRPLLLSAGTIALVALACVATTLVPAGASAATQPGFARRDRVRQADGCTEDYAGTRASSCPFGAKAGEYLVLFGDSHAEAWLPAFDGVAKQRGLRGLLFSKGACPPFAVSRFLPNYRRSYRECDAWRSNVLSALRKLHPALVVVASYGAYGSTLLEASGSKASLGDAPRIWQAGAAGIFDQLARVTPRIVVMRDVPRPGFDVPACLSQRGDARCSFDREAVLAEDAALYAAEVAAAAGRPNLKFVDLSAQICPANPCVARAADGIIKYRDPNHLTATFSATLAAPLLAELF